MQEMQEMQEMQKMQKMQEMQMARLRMQTTRVFAPESTQKIAIPLEFHHPERELLWALMQHLQFSAEKRTAVMAAYHLRHPVGKKSLPQHSDLQHLTLETPETSLDLARVVHWYEDACITAT